MLIPDESKHTIILKPDYLGIGVIGLVILLLMVVNKKLL
jgi:hypothetical protein